MPEEDAAPQPFRLTPKGKRLIEKAIPAWEKAQQQASELLGDEGSRLAQRAAKKLRALKKPPATHEPATSKKPGPKKRGRSPADR